MLAEEIEEVLAIEPQYHEILGGADRGGPGDIGKQGDIAKMLSPLEYGEGDLAAGGILTDHAGATRGYNIEGIAGVAALEEGIASAEETLRHLQCEAFLLVRSKQGERTRQLKDRAPLINIHYNSLGPESPIFVKSMLKDYIFC